MTVKRGQHLISRGTYQARGFVLAPGELLPEDAQDFQAAGHAPKLVPIMKGDRFAAVMIARDGKVFVRVERDGQSFACALLPDSFDLA